MKNVPITAVVMTKNEQIALPDCLESLQGFSQVVVIDSGSTDSTVEIADKAGAEVVNFEWDGKYPKKKQWILDNVDFKNDWVLYVDADERPSAALVAEMASTVKTANIKKVGAFDTPLDYVFMGKLLKHGHQVVKRTLLNRHLCSFPVVDDLGVSNMWEVEGHYQPEVRGSVQTFTNHLVHDDRDPLYGYFSRHNRYSDWEAHLRVNPKAREQVRGVRTRNGKIFDKVPGKPLAFFLYSYVARSGWRDGRAGFDYALALAFYYWQIDAKTRELSGSHA